MKFTLLLLQKMTCIAIKVQKNKITLAADSQITAGQQKSYTKKIFEVGEIVFWGAGYLNELQLIKSFLIENGYEEKTIKSESALFEVFANFYKYLKEKGVIDQREGMEKAVFNSFIVVVKNLKKAYVFSYWSLREIEDIFAVGSGAKYALPILDETKDIEKAIEYAKKYDIYCGGDTVVHEFTF